MFELLQLFVRFKKKPNKQARTFALWNTLVVIKDNVCGFIIVFTLKKKDKNCGQPHEQIKIFELARS
jgi:hypothetical protein